MLKRSLVLCLTLAAMLLSASAASAAVEIKLWKTCDGHDSNWFDIEIHHPGGGHDTVPTKCEDVPPMVRYVAPGTYTIKEKEPIPAPWWQEDALCKDMTTGAETHDLVDMVMEDGRTYECRFWNKKASVPAMGTLGLGVTLVGLGAAFALRRRNA